MKYKFMHLPRLGVGISYKPQFAKDIRKYIKDIDFLEIIAEQLFESNNTQIKLFQELSKLFTIVPHAVSLSLGSVDGINHQASIKLKEIAKKLNSPWVSDHICFTESAGISIGHLSPLPFSMDSVSTLINNFRSLQDTFHVPIILENIAHLFFIPIQEMSEAEFITKIVNSTNCGLLLDVHNLYANCLNHGTDPIGFLNAFPINSIVQLHVSGGSWLQGYYLDTHAAPVPIEVWRLVELILQEVPVRGIVVERDDDINLELLVDDVKKAKILWSRYCK